MDMLLSTMLKLCGSIYSEKVGHELFPYLDIEVPHVTAEKYRHYPVFAHIVDVGVLPNSGEKSMYLLTNVRDVVRFYFWCKQESGWCTYNHPDVRVILRRYADASLDCSISTVSDMSNYIECYLTVFYTQES